jgi:trehalose synthase-fused probable maltokinase
MTGSPDYPTIATEALALALDLPALRQLDGAPLAAFLSRQRWFGGKTAAPDMIRVQDVVRLPWYDGVFAIARVLTETAGARQLYQLPLAVSPGDPAQLPEAARPALIARVQTPEETGFLFDAVHDPRFRRGLADASGTRCEFAGEDGTSWVISSLSEARLVVPAEGPVELGMAEQSNTSIIFNRQAIMKLFRRLEPGQHPEVELTRFLTLDAGFPHTPVLLGTVEFTDRDGTCMVAGMLQEYLAGSIDAWGYTLEAAAAAVAGTPGAEDYTAQARHLGEVTRQLHAALASGTTPDMIPEDATAGDVAEWVASGLRWLDTAMGLLRTRVDAGALSPDALAGAQALLARRDVLQQWITATGDALDGDAGRRIRIHGDYHLGQVLRTRSDDFIVIDFEGEPARPLADRRRKASPLRDVAGMLRSLAYAAATLARQGGAPAAAAWEAGVRQAFLRGYLGNDAGGAGLLPSSPAATERLLALLEAEKTLYELAYELNNRPDWVEIPLQGMTRIG